MREKHKQDEQKFFEHLIRYLKGESCDLGCGHDGPIKAEIAKQLIAETPELLDEDKQATLIKAVDMAYARRDRLDVPF